VHVYSLLLGFVVIVCVVVVVVVVIYIYIYIYIYIDGLIWYDRYRLVIF
jgi:hypothetical protein